MVSKITIPNYMFITRKCEEKDINPKSMATIAAAILLAHDDNKSNVKVDIDYSGNQALFILMGIKGKTATYSFEELITH